MKVVVVYKWCRNAADALVRTDGTVDWRNAKMTAGEDDPAALAAAKQIVADVDGDLVGLTVGDGEASWALARGVTKALSVTDAPHTLDNASMAAVLAAAIGQMGDVDVVVIGDSKQEAGVSVALAGALGWPGLVGARTAGAPDGKVRVSRHEDGDIRVMEVDTPVVIGLAADADVDTVPGMKELLAARKREVMQTTLEELGITSSDVAEVAASVPSVTAARVFDGDPATAVKQLVDALRSEGVL